MEKAMDQRTSSSRRGPRVGSAPSPRDGATTVEFSLMFPVVLAFFIFSVIFLQAFMLRDTAQHAAYKGARRGMVLGATTADVEAEVAAFLSRVGIRNPVVRTVPAAISDDDDVISVSVEIRMSENAWIGGPFLPQNFAPMSTVTLRKKID